MLSPSQLVLLLVGSATLGIAAPAPFTQSPFAVSQLHFDVLEMRTRMPLNPKALLDVQCLDRRKHIVFHDQNAAELSICDGSLAHPPSSSSQPPTPRCRGNPVLTTGRSGTALFTVAALTKGATVNVDRDSWEQCVRAARAVCPTGSMTGTCWGGATQGNIGFTLDLAGFWNE